MWLTFCFTTGHKTSYSNLLGIPWFIYGGYWSFGLRNVPLSSLPLFFIQFFFFFFFAERLRVLCVMLCQGGEMKLN